MKKITFFLLFIVLSSFLFKAHATKYYVNLNSTGKNDGSSWSNAFNSLSSALAVSSTGDEIWVARGVYKPSHEGFNIPSGVSLYGGFIGTENDKNERDLSTNTTTLDGNIGDLSISTDNASHVIFMRNVNNRTKINGFKIINGRATSNSNNAKGGGLYNNGGSPTISNCQFLDNFSADFGGGICSENGNIKIDNCTISNNTVDHFGGGIFFGQNGTAIITNSKINYNKSIFNSGGGIATGNGFSSLIIDRTEISGNSVQDFGGAIVVGDDTSLKVYNSLFLGNIARLRIISMHTTFNMQSHKVINCTFSGNNSNENTSKSSTVVFNDSSEIINSIFWDNKAPDGNVYKFNTLIDPDVVNCILEDNHESGTDNLVLDPKFKNPSSKDFAPFSSEDGYNYNVTSNSPSINSGNDSYLSNTFNMDLNGLPRKYNSETVDIGCYEYQGTSTLSLENNNLSSFTSFYNSNTESIEIKTNEILKLNYKIYNINGTLVNKGLIIGKSDIKLNHLSSGLYILNLIYDNSHKMISKKIIKN